MIQVLEYYDDEGSVKTDVGMRAEIAGAAGVTEADLGMDIQVAEGAQLDAIASLYGIKRREGAKPEPSQCYHEYVPYIGFRESYEFCKHCDEKKPSWMK